MEVFSKELLGQVDLGTSCCGLDAMTKIIVSSNISKLTIQHRLLQKLIDQFPQLFQ